MSRVVPQISIVVPAYNAARFLQETVESARAQTFPHWEMIIVDDGSADLTPQIARGCAESDDRIRWFTQENAGPSAARNAGYAHCHPESQAVIFLDADDVWEPTTLTTLWEALQARPDAAAAYGLAYSINAEGGKIELGVLESHQRERWGIENGKAVRWPADRPTTFAVEALVECIITPGTVLLRRAVLGESGLFAFDLRMWEDWDLWLRVSRCGPMLFCDTPVLGYRRHDSNLSNASEAVEEGARYVRRRLLDSLTDDAVHLSIAQAGCREAQKLLAWKRLAWAKSNLRQGKVLDSVKQVRHAVQHLANLRHPAPV